jgi:hypothetical protein
MAPRTNAPYWITTHYGGRCDECRRGIKKGEDALYFPATKKLLCSFEPCGPKAEQDLQAKRAEQLMYGEAR